MRRPGAQEIAEYCDRYDVAPTVAWRDYLQLRLAEATSRDTRLFELCVWKGAFFARFVLDSARGSGDLDATVGTNKDVVDPAAIRRQLIRACQDLGIEIPKPDVLEGGERSVSFSAIRWEEAEVGAVVTSIEMRDACRAAVEAWVM